MNAKRLPSFMTICCCVSLLLAGLLTSFSCASAAEKKSSLDSRSYEQILDRVITVYPNLQSAVLQVRRSTLELDRIYASLGWNASVDSYISHDLGNFGTPADVFSTRGALTRKLLSGDRISVDASYARTDNEINFINTLPNPSNDSSVNLTYRRPLSKGADNVEYYSLEESAQAQIAANRAEEFALKDSLAGQVANLFYGLATIEVNLANTREGIERLQRLLSFVSRNKKLGISEEKDILQTRARLNRKLAEESSLETARNQQIYNLNRLMNLPASSRYKTRLDYSGREIPGRAALLEQVFSYSPAYSKASAAKQAAESQIKLQQDNKKDVIDVIASVGARAKSGPSEEMDISESDFAGTLGLEYRASLDKRGLDATYQQALLDRDIAENQLRQLTIDLNSEVDRLLGLINDQRKSIASNRRLQKAEQSKFDEAVSRYRTGRTTTADLINFEEDLSVAQSALANSRVNLLNTINELDRLRGALWSKESDSPS
jgi:outer membrane protein TolC